MRTQSAKDSLADKRNCRWTVLELQLNLETKKDGHLPATTADFQNYFPLTNLQNISPSRKNSNLNYIAPLRNRDIYKLQRTIADLV